MTVDFPASYPSSAAPSGKPIDVQTLQQTFAALLRSYGTEKGGSKTETLLEILRPSPSDKTEGHDRNQQRQDNQQRTDRNDFTPIDRKLLDKSEIRSGEIIADYQNRLDRQDSLHDAYRARVERSELSHSTIPADSFPLALPGTSANAPRPSEVPPLGEHAPPQPSAVPQVAGTHSQSSLASTAVPSSAPSSALANTAGMPMNMNVPVSAPIVSQASPTATFTVFTPSGRWGQSQKDSEDPDSDNNSDNNGGDDEEGSKEKNSKKQQPFAVFEAVRVETTRPLHRHQSRQSKEPAPQITEKFSEETSEKTREAEPQSLRNVKTIADLLAVPTQSVTVQSVTVQKGGESNQSQYLHRIAAACEAASQYAPIRMKINLDHLGTLTLRFYYKADKLALRFNTPSKESARFVRDHLDGLRTILSHRNVQIADMEIYSETEIN